MNRRTSRPSSSRKYSAIVRPVRPTRWRAPGGSFIWPNTNAVLLMTPDSVISWMRSLPSRDRSPTPANTDTPACCFATLLMSSWMMTVLPTPAPPKIPILPPFLNGQMRSMTLRPGLEHLDLGGLVLERGRGAVDRQHLVRLDLALAVDGVAEHVEHAPERHLAHRHGDRCAGVADLGPAGEAVGRRHGDGADPVVAQVLLHLAHERRLAFAQDLDGAEDRGQVPGGELDVDDRPGDLDHPAVRGRRGGRHGGECLLVCAWPSGPGRRSRSRPSRE